MRKYLGYTEKELIEWNNTQAPIFEEMCKNLEGEALKKYKREYIKMVMAFGEMCNDQTIDILPKEQS